MSAYPALGFDPAPGDLGLVESMVDRLSASVDDLDEARYTLTGDDDSSWVGKSANAFRDAISDDFRPHLEASGNALRDSRDALRNWATQLASHQLSAAVLEEAAATAAATVASRVEAKDAANARQDSPEADPEATTSAATALASAKSALEDIRLQARSLNDQVEQDAATTAELLDRAYAIVDPYKEGRFASFAGSLGDMAGDFATFLMDELVPFIEDLLRVIAPIISIAAIFVPALGPVALGIAVTLVAIDGLQAASGRGSWGDFAMGVAGLAVGAAGSKLISNAFGKTGFPLSINPNRMMPALAGGAPAAGTLAGSLSLNFKTMMANAHWIATTPKAIIDDSNTFVDEWEKHL